VGEESVFIYFLNLEKLEECFSIDVRVRRHVLQLHHVLTVPKDEYFNVLCPP